MRFVDCAVAKDVRNASRAVAQKLAKVKKSRRRNTGDEPARVTGSIVDRCKLAHSVELAFCACARLELVTIDADVSVIAAFYIKARVEIAGATALFETSADHPPIAQI